MDKSPRGSLRAVPITLFVLCIISLGADYPKIAFLALCLGSMWMFFATLHQRIFSLFPSHGNLPFDHIPKRLWRVLTEVVLQYRVIRDRPIVGALHAIVFWGFLAFAWVSMEHLLLGIRGLEHAEATRSWYDAFAALWAGMVMIAIIGLSVRRFIVRPKALGKLSATSGVVAVLITILMATYLLGWRVFPVGSMAWEVNWWIHTGVFFAMLAVIPRSKHLHLLLAPIGIFFRSETTSAMSALRGEEDFGKIHIVDLDRKDIFDLNACVECGRCTQSCPVNLIGGSLSPKEIILDLQRGLLGGGDILAGTVEEKRNGTVCVSEKDLFQCLSCGACEYVCPVGIEHVGKKILDLRRGLVSEGRVTSDKVSQLFTTMERAPHNPWGIMQDARQKFIESKQFPLFDGSQEWLFWLGCGLSFESHGQKVACAMQQILDTAHVSWGVLPRETCCGEPARRLGNEGLFLELSEKLIATLADARVKNIVTCCPHCMTMFDKDYRQMASYEALGIRVMHHTELIAELRPRLPIVASHMAVTYHDPCYLARGRGIVAAPREILGAVGASITEASHCGKNTQCCGAGGGRLFTADDRKERGENRVNQLRCAELAVTGASTIAVACSYCHTMLRDAVETAKSATALNAIAAATAARKVSDDDSAAKKEAEAYAEKAMRDTQYYESVQVCDIAEIVARSISQELESNATKGGESMTQETIRIGGAEYRYKRNPNKTGYDYVGSDGVRYRRHSNGDGLVAETASVDDTVHVGPQCRVFGNARLTTGVRLTGNAQVGGNVIAEKGVIFGGGDCITEGSYDGPQIVIRSGS